jgi:hypothetical protein
MSTAGRQLTGCNIPTTLEMPTERECKKEKEGFEWFLEYYLAPELS